MVQITFQKISSLMKTIPIGFTQPTMYTPCSIISDQLIYVAQIGVDQRHAGGNFANPSFNTVPSIEHYENSIQFSTLLSSDTSYYSVVLPNDA